jgi:transposase
LKKLALADLAGGMSARKVGERYGLSHQTVNNWRNADKAERG